MCLAPRAAIVKAEYQFSHKLVQPSEIIDAAKTRAVVLVWAHLVNLIRMVVPAVIVIVDAGVSRGASGSGDQPVCRARELVRRAVHGSRFAVGQVEGSSSSSSLSFGHRSWVVVRVCVCVLRGRVTHCWSRNVSHPFGHL